MWNLDFKPPQVIEARVLTRLPDAEEVVAFTAWMEKHAEDKDKAIGDFAWALCSSTEWFVNH